MPRSLIHVPKSSAACLYTNLESVVKGCETPFWGCHAFRTWVMTRTRGSVILVKASVAVRATFVKRSPPSYASGRTRWALHNYPLQRILQ